MSKTRNKLKLTGLLLTVVMIVSLLGAFSLTASAAEGTAIDLSSLTETYVISNSGEYIFTGSGCYGIKVESGNPRKNAWFIAAVITPITPLWEGSRKFSRLGSR